jgi:hypothetical protein
MSNTHIILDGVEYRTKAALAEVCRSIIANAADHEPLAKEHSRIVAELFRRHPEYLEKSFPGIQGFSVATDSRWRTTRHFIVQRIDGTSIDFSWKICIDGQLPERRIDVLASMRSAVADQILAFRDSSFSKEDLLQCPITGEPITRSNCHVDHIFPKTFLGLAGGWLKQFDLSFEEIQLARSADGYGWDLADFKQTLSWQSFHRINADLRIVSRRANLSDLQRISYASRDGLHELITGGRS